MKLKFYDNTRLSAFKTCQRKFYFRHVRHWAGEGVSSALAFGSAWHRAMDVLWLTRSVDKAMIAWENEMLENGFDADILFEMNDMRNWGTAKAMLTNYLKQYGNWLDTIKILGVEQPFAVPLGKSAKTFYVGRLDKIWKPEKKGHVFTHEHKTTSKYKKDGPFRADFMSSFSPNAQIDGYAYAGQLLYPDSFKGVWVDAALVHKTVHNGFRVIPIDKSLSMLDAWLWEAIYYANEIDTSLKMLEVCSPDDPYMRTFPKNTESCQDYYGCVYQSVCRFHPNPMRVDTPEGFKVEKWEPFKELELEKIGLEEE
jgi:hypothetical protein